MLAGIMSSMTEQRAPEPVMVLDVLAEERRIFLDLLASLAKDDWQRPTCCPGWTVQDIALHLLGGDFGVISRHRDGYAPQQPRPDETLVPFLNRINDEWVTATRRLSPALLIELLRLAGELTYAHFARVDLMALDARVSWAGPDPAPRWLDVAREYTERWVHHQQIREAVGAPLMDEPRWIGPVVATFVHALRMTYATVDAPLDTAVALIVEGEGGGSWSVVRSAEGDWTLFAGQPDAPTATARMDQDTLWRLFTKQITPADAAGRVSIAGDRDLGRRLLGTVSIIA
jgi:uncharacterized protein (TIGR03083 family)